MPRTTLDGQDPGAEPAQSPGGGLEWGCIPGAAVVGIPVAVVNLWLLLQSVGKVVGSLGKVSTTDTTGDLAAASFTLGWTLFCWEGVGGFLLVLLGQLFRGGPRLLGRSLGGGLLLGVILTGAFFLLILGVCFVGGTRRGSL